MSVLRHIHTPGHPLHVTQRQGCFFGTPDRLAYRDELGRQAGEQGCALHAYALMGNHVHLLLTPQRRDGVTALMQALARRHAQYLAEAQGYEGPLWDEAFETTPVHVRQYLLACMRYIELNPVRAGLVRRPQAYPWSSFRANALGEADALITPHAHYCALGRTGEARQAAYRALFREKAWHLW